MLKKSLWIWLSFIPLAFLNGILRDKLIAPSIGMEYAEPLSGILFCVLIFIVVWLFVPRLGWGTKKQFLWVGLTWLLLTVVFETTMGLVTGMSGHEILRQYDVTTGNLWLMVVLFIWLAPFLAARMKKLIIHEK